MVDSLGSLCRLTFALSGAPPQKQTKDAPLFGASALERVVRQLHAIGTNAHAIHLDAFLSGSRSRYSRTIGAISWSQTSCIIVPRAWRCCFRSASLAILLMRGSASFSV